jgi:hypothetical protein
MFFLFADESGTITFAKGTQYFVYVGILVKSRKDCAKILEKLKSNYKKQFGRKFTKKEIKSSRLDKNELRYFIKGLDELDYEIFYAYVDTFDKKKEFNLDPDGSSKRLQLLELVITNTYSFSGGVGKILIDKGVSQLLRLSLRKRLSEKFKDVPLIEEAASHKVAGIQIADLIAGAINKNLKGNNSYYILIEDKVRVKTEI